MNTEENPFGSQSAKRPIPKLDESQTVPIVVHVRHNTLRDLLRISYATGKTIDEVVSRLVIQWRMEQLLNHKKGK